MNNIQAKNELIKMSSEELVAKQTQAIENQEKTCFSCQFVSLEISREITDKPRILECMYHPKILQLKDIEACVQHAFINLDDYR